MDKIFHGFIVLINFKSAMEKFRFSFFFIQDYKYILYKNDVTDYVSCKASLLIRFRALPSKIDGSKRCTKHPIRKN